MEKIFNINLALNVSELTEAIHQKTTQARAITSCLLATSDGPARLCNELLYGCLWAIDSLLDELNCLHERLCEVCD